MKVLILIASIVALTNGADRCRRGVGCQSPRCCSSNQIINPPSINQFEQVVQPEPIYQQLIQSQPIIQPQPILTQPSYIQEQLVLPALQVQQTRIQTMTCPSGFQSESSCMLGCMSNQACFQGYCCPLPVCPTGLLAAGFCSQGCPVNSRCYKGSCCEMARQVIRPAIRPVIQSIPQPIRQVVQSVAPVSQVIESTMPTCPGSSRIAQLACNRGCPKQTKCFRGGCCPQASIASAITPQIQSKIPRIIEQMSPIQSMIPQSIVPLQQSISGYEVIRPTQFQSNFPQTYEQASQLGVFENMNPRSITPIQQSVYGYEVIQNNVPQIIEQVSQAGAYETVIPQFITSPQQAVSGYDVISPSQIQNNVGFVEQVSPYATNYGYENIMRQPGQVFQQAIAGSAVIQPQVQPYVQGVSQYANSVSSAAYGSIQQPNLVYEQTRQVVQPFGGQYINQGLFNQDQVVDLEYGK